jgi:hypothetical protein
MIDSFGADLRRRMGELAEAVPVDAPGAIAAVPATRVRARRMPARLWFPGSVPVVVLVVIGIALASLAGGRLPGPGATQPLGTARASSGSSEVVPPSGPARPSAIDRDSEFTLELHAGKARYRPDEPIDVTASLTYSGPDDTVEIGHDGAGPIAFGIRERVFGEIEVQPISDLMCRRTALERSVPFVKPFAKSGGFSGDHPEASRFRDWLLDPVLRLPEGAYHVYARVQTGCGAAGSPNASLEAQIVIVVSGDPAATR